MIEKLLSYVTETEKNLKIKMAVLGLGYIAIEIEGGFLGLSANIGYIRESYECSAFSKAGSLAGSHVRDVLNLFSSNDRTARSIILAIINALNCMNGSYGDVFDHIEINTHDQVVLVGFIEPVAQMLTQKGCVVSAFDERPLTNPFIKPKESMIDILSHADVIIITATTIINDTLEDILNISKNTRQVILMGPSTPMICDAFSSSPVTYLAGARVVERDKAFRIVMEGGGTPELYKSKAMKKTILEVI